MTEKINDPEFLSRLVMKKQLALDTSSAAVDLTVTFAPCARRIYCGGAGVVRTKMVGDAAYVNRTVSAGQYIDGVFVAVDSTANGTTATLLVAEQ